MIVSSNFLIQIYPSSAFARLYNGLCAFFLATRECLYVHRNSKKFALVKTLYTACMQKYFYFMNEDFINFIPKQNARYCDKAWYYLGNSDIRHA
jgi:hypothetical protein